MDPLESPVEPAVRSRVRAVLAGAPMFADLGVERRKELEETNRRAELLEAYGGRMPGDVFAQRPGLPVWRVGGAVAGMAEFLYVDEYLVIQHTVNPVMLDPRCLEQISGAARC